ncbi:MAG: RNA pseudouridine synthase [Kiritimatiellaeota bacterium]|nr:RNA pseudouridine synthase [Kiritimatiellota bacterium]
MTPCGRDDELAHHPAQPERMIILTNRNRAKARKAMRALTEFTVAENLGKFTLLRVVIETGVTHQIRCQLAARGHAVVGDKIYGAPGADALGLARHFLHAARLEFVHPVTAAPLKLATPLPPELTAILAQLRCA